jgi:hypothetical protein
MPTIAELRDSAWDSLRSARLLADNRKWLKAVGEAGMAIELILKTRVCSEMNLSKWPDSRGDAKLIGIGHLFDHDLESLLKGTSAYGLIKTKYPLEWSRCIQWDKNTKYQPLGTQNKTSAVEFIRAADAIFREIEAGHSVWQAVYASTDNPYVKLREVEKNLSDKKGPFNLFAICHREGAYQDSAEVVVCATWIDTYTQAGVQEVYDEIVRSLGQDETASRISAIIALTAKNPFVVALSTVLNYEHGFNHFKNCVLNGVELDAHTVITSMRSN